jgi:hypothetical protein
MLVSIPRVKRGATTLNIIAIGKTTLSLTAFRIETLTLII